MRLITTNRIATAMLGLALILPVSAWSEDAATVVTPAAATAAPVAIAAPQTEEARRERVEQRIADMHATLRITPPQEMQWNIFAQVMLDNAQAMKTAHAEKAAMTDGQTAPEVMQSYAHTAQVHAQNVEKLSAAFATLYTGFTPDQRKVADEVFRDRASEQKQAG